MTASPDDPSPTSAPSTSDGIGVRWESVAEMAAGDLVEIPVHDDGPPSWLRVIATKPPSWTGEYRWALVVGCGEDEWWIKVAPQLVFRTADGVPGCP